jgi:hypothetical protein
MGCPRKGRHRDGVHYVNGTLAGTPAVLLRHPEALVYAPEHGHLQLAALEYVVLKSAWDQAHGKNAPRGCMGTGSIFQPFGLPTFYSPHAWILKHNPADTGTPPLVANAVTR